MMARRSSLCVVLVLTIVAACDAPQATDPVPQFSTSTNSTDALAQEVRVLAAARGVVPLPRAQRVRQPLVVLGQMLAFDKILSGNRNISCMSCHVARFGTGDGKSLSVGEGGTSVGPGRTHPQGIFIPRNAPPLFNLGAMDKLFWDGRVQIDGDGNLQTPAGSHITSAMQDVFEFGAISALPMFPVTNRAEMRGESGNELAEIADEDFTGIWRGLMQRLGGIPQYRALFEAAYPGTRFDDMTFAHASNAMAGFFVDRLSTANSPWDRFLAGSNKALSAAQLEGAKTFMTIRCSLCHNGTTLSDQEFHNVAVAQIGPGVGDGVDARDDFGRERVTGDPADRYRFRTTPLRNVELTAPYGHDGAIVSLREFIEHYSESHVKLQQYDVSPLEPLLRNTLVPNAERILATRDVILDGVVLPDDVVTQLMAYMSALTDDAAVSKFKHIAPARVPSGLPVDR
jgi:cytochrome c peroxidase